MNEAGLGLQFNASHIKAHTILFGYQPNWCYGGIRDLDKFTSKPGDEPIHA